MAVSFTVQSISFVCGNDVHIAPGSTTVIVGPNNSGKTATLNEIYQALRALPTGPVVARVKATMDGTPEEIRAWLEERVGRVTSVSGWGRPGYVWMNAGVSDHEIKHGWGPERKDLVPFFCSILRVEDRLALVEPKDTGKLPQEGPTHPLHVLLRDDSLEPKVARLFHLAFGTDITLNRAASNSVQFHVGPVPARADKEDRVSASYIARLARLPLLHEQGHGMRSFMGCVLHMLTSHCLVELLDEPEMFLHPSHARLLGRLLVTEKPAARQLIIATHSGDFLRGLLDATPPDLRVLRITRQGTSNAVHELDLSQIRELWSDPILRFSNVLDGLFHESVVVCEGDADCRFYAAVLQAIQSDDETRPPDIMFCSAGGKQRIPVVVRSLIALGVKTVAVTDFDIIRDKDDLRKMVNAVGGTFTALESDWKTVADAISQKAPPLTIHQVRDQINQVLSTEQDGRLSEKAKEEIRKALRESSPWGSAKLAGLGIVPSGAPHAAAQSLIRRLRQYGVFVVACGELERFVPGVGLHGPAWVSAVLEKDLAADPELEPARSFVADLVGLLHPILRAQRGQPSDTCADFPAPSSHVPAVTGSGVPSRRTTVFERIGRWLQCGSIKDDATRLRQR